MTASHSVTKEVKEQKSTSLITSKLQKSPRKLDFFSTLSGNYNPQLPSLNATEFFANFNMKNGVGKLCDELIALAKGGAAEMLPLAPIGPRFLVLKKPQLIANVFKQGKNLVDDDASGVQPFIFHPTTIVNQPLNSDLYIQLRHAFQKHVTNPIAEFIPGIHRIYDFYKKEELDKKEITDFRNVAERFAITVMFHNVIGADITDLPESDKTILANCVHDLVGEITTPMTTAVIIAQNKTRGLTEYLPETAVDILEYAKKKLYEKTDVDLDLKAVKARIKEAEDVLAKAIKKNEQQVFKKLKGFTEGIDAIKEYEIKEPKDLYSPVIMGLIKLILVGGFETTSKLLLYTAMFIANPKNKKFVDEMRRELSECKKAAHELDYEDLKELKYTQAFVFEILRLYPPFSLLKAQAKNAFWLDENIYVPAGTGIISSAFHAHRDESIYKDAHEFKPERWFEKFDASGREKFSIDTAPFKDYFFSFGRLRHCPGRRIPFFEAIILSLRTISDFEKIELTGVDISKRIEEHLELGFTLELKEGITVGAAFKPRQQQEIEVKDTPKKMSPAR